MLNRLSFSMEILPLHGECEYMVVESAKPIAICKGNQVHNSDSCSMTLCSYDARTDVTFCLTCFGEEKARRSPPIAMQGWRSQASNTYAAAGTTHAMMTM